jgi:hypothetical protein
MRDDDVEECTYVYVGCVGSFYHIITYELI